MIVIDASILAAYILKEPKWKRLEIFIVSSCSVDLIVKEVANSIWKAFHRGLISKDNADKKFLALISLININVKLYEQSRIIQEAYTIAMKHNITIYDSIYIALAKKLKAKLVTLDKRQHLVAKNEGISCELIVL